MPSPRGGESGIEKKWVVSKQIYRNIKSQQHIDEYIQFSIFIFKKVFLSTHFLKSVSLHKFQNNFVEIAVIFYVDDVVR